MDLKSAIVGVMQSKDFCVLYLSTRATWSVIDSTE